MSTTPASEMDIDDSPKSPFSMATSSKKRIAELDSDDDLRTQPTKRRAFSKQVYVQVPSSKLPTMGKV